MHPPMIDWQNINTALLDMDGTLLDLNYDNYFWQEYVPMHYARQQGLDIDEAKRLLAPRYRAVEGTIDWYCVDYWSASLNLDIALLKEEIAHLIAVHPHVTDFLVSLRNAGKRAVLVTNAHHKSLALKMGHTRLAGHFDRVVCAHDFGMPKEDIAFWEHLHKIEHFNLYTTLLIDDNHNVLRTARQYGIHHLLAVHRPDTQKAGKTTEEFQIIYSFKDVIPAK